MVPLRLRLLGLLGVLLLGVGCPCVKGPVNASPALRWWLFSNFGAQRVCPEMLKRGAPLKLNPTGNTIGRFFPTRCQHEINDDAHTMTLHFGGTGFAWTPVAGRVGFSAEASVEYQFDFFMGEDDIYVWAKRPRILRGPEFQVGSVENKVVNWGLKSPAGWMVDQFGAQIVSSQLASGFTVLHGDAGDDFSLGILVPPQKPRHPFDTSKGERFVFANETTEIRSNQIDFLGPFEVEDKDQALFFRMRVDGPAAEAFLFQRGTGDLWRDALQRGAALGPPPGPPMLGFPLPANVDVKKRIPVPRGSYYLVVDNSSAFGQVSPPWNPLAVVGGGTAVVSYSAEIGDDDDEF
ncbi:MAG: hypothetical protein IPI67_22010 [Myxococcales bacterium]|nr:hypothetical protein [Myxococcales bacterium]